MELHIKFASLRFSNFYNVIPFCPAREPNANKPRINLERTIETKKED